MDLIRLAPRLYVSGYRAAARHPDFYRICVCDSNREARFANSHYPIDEDDLPETFIRHARHVAAEAIREIEKGRRVLIYCHAGRNRSVSCSIYTIAKYSGLPLGQILSHVRSVHPEESIMDEIMRFLHFRFRHPTEPESRPALGKWPYSPPPPPGEVRAERVKPQVERVRVEERVKPPQQRRKVNSSEAHDETPAVQIEINQPRSNQPRSDRRSKKPSSNHPRNKKSRHRHPQQYPVQIQQQYPGHPMFNRYLNPGCQQGYYPPGCQNPGQQGMYYQQYQNGPIECPWQVPPSDGRKRRPTIVPFDPQQYQYRLINPTPHGHARDQDQTRTYTRKR